MTTKSPTAPTESVPHTHGHHTVLTILVIVSLLLNIVSVYFLLGYSFDLKTLSAKSDSALGIKKVLLDLEYEKVGGKDNYDILQKYSQLQITEQIDKIKQYVNGGAQADAATPTATTEPKGTLTPEEVKTVLDDASIEGNKDATVIAIEYSDMECPFCMRQYHDTKLFPALLSQYGDKVSAAFKNNRGVNHKGTEAKAIAALCADTVGGDEKYISFYKAIMDGSTNEGGVLDVAKLPELAKTLGLDTAKWQSCMDTKATLARFEAQTSEAQKFNLNGTPGTLLLNVKTGKYDTVE